MSNPLVTRWAHLAQRAAAASGVPAAVLLGLTEVESGGRPGLRSSAGAQGITQFVPDTAKSYGVDVRPGHEGSQLMGTGHYLADLGFADDPRTALAKYNAGPNATPAALAQGYKYADKVLAAAAKYASISPGTSPGTSPGSVSSRPTSTVTKNSDPAWALRALLTVALIGLGLALLLHGGGRLVGVDVAKGAKRAAKGAAAAAMVPK